MSKIPKFIVVTVTVILLVAAYLVAIKTARTASASPKYIEVCSQGTAYVPRDTKYVTCQGKVMKVIGIVPLEEGQEALLTEDCSCPKCCGGFCSVLVACRPEPETSSGRDGCPDSQKASPAEMATAGGGLCFMYLACGD